MKEIQQKKMFLNEIIVQKKHNYESICYNSKYVIPTFLINFLHFKLLIGLKKNYLSDRKFKMFAFDFRHIKVFIF